MQLGRSLSGLAIMCSMTTKDLFATLILCVASLLRTSFVLIALYCQGWQPRLFR